MFIALAFAHFSSELLLKDQMIIPVKKTTLVISTQNWSILAKFAKKNPAKSAVFYWLSLGKVSPRNFPWNRPIFLRICPWKSFEIWLFFAKIAWNQTIFRRILTFLPQNWPIFPRILTLFPWNRPIFPRICPCKSHEILLFFPRNIRSPVDHWSLPFFVDSTFRP